MIVGGISHATTSAALLAHQFFYDAPLGLCRNLCRVPSTDVLGSIIASLRDWKADRP
jgi:hypothetical protein